ncbi:flagellar hook capping FlgD N-terminal domain-containing protein [Pseudoxanthomonas sp.]|uniref:flagellar hook capping FlgD N-terminal domain-containing protein n=1 Tax=Pseudoxanthomonas sp. TaxID=1871049 RepID=UPI00261326AD|nr:flagellar hook capping FlgD N-terminal domain-containing protein [Pseudoxanthomonas sp.]WDS36853.1 MAG: flagellar hook capping FlgD N-terminal domain-containing protein [Pseudoxanthomonas sp.]
MNAISTDALSSLGLTATSRKSVAERQQADENTQKDKLGQADFLMMMTQQLKNQDPLNPMDNGAFLAQLAQISTVQGLSDLNKKADQFLGVNGSDQALRGAALIGRQVEVPGSGLSLPADGEANASLKVDGPGAVNVVVKDGNGVPVRSFVLDAGPAGARQVAWDGKDDAGHRQPAGNYRLTATQTGSDGRPIPLDTQTQATVESVSLGKDGVTLNLAGGQSIPLAQVQRIS